MPAGDLELRGSLLAAPGTPARCGWRPPTGSRASRAAPRSGPRRRRSIFRRTISAPMISCSQSSGTASRERHPPRMSSSRCGSGGSSARSGACCGSPLVGSATDERVVDVDVGRFAVPRPATDRSRRRSEAGSTRPTGRTRRSSHPRSPESCDRLRDDRVEDFVEVEARRDGLADLAERAQLLRRSGSSCWKSSTFWIAIAACAASVVKSSIVRSPNGSTSSTPERRAPRRPGRRPASARRAWSGIHRARARSATGRPGRPARPGCGRRAAPAPTRPTSVSGRAGTGCRRMYSR